MYELFVKSCIVNDDDIFDFCRNRTKLRERCHHILERPYEVRPSVLIQKVVSLRIVH